jgi:hypothetical protein
LQAGLLLDGRDEVGGGLAGFHHEEVRALFRAAAARGECVAAVAHVELVRAAVAELRRGVRGVAERAVVVGRELGAVAHDGREVEARAVERGAQVRDAAVVHVGGRDAGGAGLHVAHAERGERGVRRGEVLAAARVVDAAVAGLGEAAEAGVDPDRGVVAGALAHLLERGAGEVGGEVAVRLGRGDGEEQELAHAGVQVLVELREQGGERVPRGALQALDRFLLRRGGREEQRLDEVADPEADLGRHVPQRRGGAQSLQSFHGVTVWAGGPRRYGAVLESPLEGSNPRARV